MKSSSESNSRGTGLSRTGSGRTCSWLAGALLGVLALAFGVPGAAVAGPDDFEFGEKLAERRFFDLAKKVYEAMIADPNRSEEDKQAAKYGLANLARGRAEAATAGDLPYSQVKDLFEAAGKDIATFVQNNPGHPRSQDAQLSVGFLRLTFVQWSESLLNDPKELEERKSTPDEVRADAGRAVDQAIDYFDKLRPKGTAQPSNLAQLADLQWVVSQYYKALVLPPCSKEQTTALETAAGILDQYIADNDGSLVAVYAQDIFGLVFWKLAVCEQDTKKKVANYDKAVEWFRTCIETEYLGDDHLKVITSGYYHLGQVCLAAGEIAGERNYLRTGADILSQMDTKQPTAWRMDNGIKAILEWAKIECARGETAKAVDVARKAGEKAKTDRKLYLERVANRVLNDVVSSGCGAMGSGSMPSDPAVLQRVADDLMQQEKYPEAIRAYRSVIASLPDTPQAFVDFAMPTWKNVSIAFRRQGDLLGAALALESVHDAWMDGRIPYKGDPTEKVFVEAGNMRNDSIATLHELARKSGSKVFSARAESMLTTYAADYKDHPSTKSASYNNAVNALRQYAELKRQKSSSAGQKLAEARRFLQEVAADNSAPNQDLALVRIAWSFLEENNPAEAVDAAKKAFAFWDSAIAKQQEEKYPDVKGRRASSKGEAKYWMAKAQADLSQWDEVITTLKTYHSDHGSAAEDFRTLAYDLLGKAHIRKGDIPSANEAWKKVLALNPKWEGLISLAGEFAKHYEVQYKEVDQKRAEIDKKLRGKDGAQSRLAKAERSEGATSNALVDLENSKKKKQELIAAYEKDKKDHNGITDREYEEAKKDLPIVSASIDTHNKDHVRFRKEKETAQKEVDSLRTELDATRQKMYGPLTQAASYYKQWDDSLKANGLERTPANLSAFASRFFLATELKPDVEENWTAARSLYEDFLAHPKVKDLPPTEPSKRAAVARLGRVYAHFAEREKDAAARKTVVSHAVDMLQNAVATRPENTELIVALLSGDLAVLPFNDTVQQKQVRFPVKKVTTVADLKKAVAELGKPGGGPLPKYANETEQRKYADEALGRFQRHVSQLPDADAQVAVDSFKKAGVDWNFYRDFAEVDSDFRLTLAWAYAESGRVDDLPRAINLSLGLTDGTLAVEEGSEEWWLAQTIRLHAYIRSAERAGADGAGTATATAVSWSDRAERHIKSRLAAYPDLGESIRPGTRAEWQGLLAELNTARRKAGQGPLTIDFAAAAADAAAKAAAAAAAAAAEEGASKAPPKDASPKDAPPKDGAPGSKDGGGEGGGVNGGSGKGGEGKGGDAKDGGKENGR